MYSKLIGVKMKKLSIEELKSVICSVLLMMLGMLFCCSLSVGINGLSVIIGLVLVVVGVVFLFNSILLENTMLTIRGLFGAIVVSLGIMFIMSKLAGIIFDYIPWLLMVVGVVIAADALINKLVYKVESVLTLVLKIVLSVISLTLGVCLRCIDGFAEYASVVLGILMIMYALYLIVKLFFGSKSSNVIS